VWTKSDPTQPVSLVFRITGIMTVQYKYYICDVFTKKRFGGNPLAVLPDASGLTDKQMQQIAREFKVSLDLVEETAKIGRMPVVNFAAGGIATPADAAYLMSLGCDGIFVGSGIFKAEDAMERARATVLATTFWEDADAVKEAQKMINEKQSILGLDVNDLELRMQERGGSA